MSTGNQNPRSSGRGEVKSRRPVAKQHQPTSVEGLEVTEGTASDWLAATIGRCDHVPHSRGEKVVQLRAAPLECWALVDFGRRA